MLPELQDRVREFFERREQSSRSVTLDLAADRKGDGANGDWYRRNGFYGLAEAHGYGSSWSGESVTLDTANNHSVFFTCNRIIGESVGVLPLNMMRKHGSEKVEATDHPMFQALHDAPNDEQTAQRFRETLTGHFTVGGDAYAKIHRRSGTGVANELEQLMPAQVTPDRDAEHRRVYVVKDGNLASKTYTVERGKPHDILHIPGFGWDGYRGYSILKLARQSIGTANATEKNVAEFFKSGGRQPYYLKLRQSFENEQAFERFRDDWERIYAQPHLAPILEPFIEEYKAIGVSAKDAQMLEMRQFTVSEICRWWRISPHLAGDLSRATFSNIEQLGQEFVTFTLIPYLKRWEQELWRCVLTPAEKQQGYFWRHNVNALLRGDFLTRMQGYSIALQNGFFSQNEVRDREDMNGFDGGDDYHIQLNMQTLPAAPVEQQPQSRVKIGSGRAIRAA